MDATITTAREITTSDELINDPLSLIENLTDEQLACIGGGSGLYDLN